MNKEEGGDSHRNGLRSGTENKEVQNEVVQAYSYGRNDMVKDYLHRRGHFKSLHNRRVS